MIIFVGGVHAVGKTFVLKPVCESLGIRHTTASQLIREQRGASSWTNSRQVSDIDENQQALITAVQRLGNEGDRVVLDGHFVLRQSIGVHEKISLDTFKQLMVRGALVLEAPSAIIMTRLLQRNDATWDETEVEVFAQQEREHAEFVCQRLSVPLTRLSSPSETDVRAAIKNLLEE